VTEGVEFKSDKERDLAVLIAHGTATWIKRCLHSEASEATPGMKYTPAPRQTADILAILLANLIETKTAV